MLLLCVCWLSLFFGVVLYVFAVCAVFDAFGVFVFFAFCVFAFVFGVFYWFLLCSLVPAVLLFSDGFCSFAVFVF